MTIYLFVFLMQTSKTQIQLFPPKSSTLTIYVGHNEEKNLLFNKTVQNNPGPGITKKSRKWWLDNLHFVGPPLLDMLMGS